MTDSLSFLPIGLRIDRTLIVGGSEEGVRKAQRLARMTSRFTFLAPVIPEEVAALGVETITKEFAYENLDGYSVVFVCTPSADRNHAIAAEARRRGMLVCVCDDTPHCDFVSPAILRDDNLTIAVGSDARDVRRAIRVRNRLRKLVEEGLLDLT